jgi:hypothetical protein
MFLRKLMRFNAASLNTAYLISMEQKKKIHLTTLSTGPLQCENSEKSLGESWILNMRSDRNVNGNFLCKTKHYFADGQPLIPPGQAGAEVFNCPDDYIVINGIRLCGERLNDASVQLDFTQNSPVTGK